MYVPTLVSLNLASAGLTGTLPPAWSVLGALTELQVQTNQLAGSCLLPGLRSTAWCG